MKKTNANGTQKLDASRESCLNEACPSRGEIGQGNIVIHDSSRGRLRCKICKVTFNKRRGTALEGIRKPEELFVTVISLISWGCPTQAIVHTYDLDERTVADWQQRAGLHCEKVHQDQIEQGKLDPKQAQADEMRIKAQGSDPTSDLWNHRAGAKAPGTIKRRINAQYFLYRTVECHLP